MSRTDADRGGPFVQAAFFCERLLQETDGVLSAIRIVDHVTSQVARPNESGQPLAHLKLSFVLSFKTGEARGARQLTVEMVPPGGPAPLAHGDNYSQTILFEGPSDRGDTVIMPISVLPIPRRVEVAGVYWFNVYLDRRLMTRVPLRVEVPEQTPGSALR